MCTAARSLRTETGVRSPALAAVFALLLGCAGGPSARLSAPDGPTWVHPDAAFSLTIPADWQIQRSRDSVSLLRRTPYGGGYPTLSARLLPADEIESVRFDGKSWTDAATGAAGTYRYLRWSNPRGRGYRLEVLLEGAGAAWLVEASVWDEALRLDTSFFEETFWPILATLRAS